MSLQNFSSHHHVAIKIGGDKDRYILSLLCPRDCDVLFPEMETVATLIMYRYTPNTFCGTGSHSFLF